MENFWSDQKFLLSEWGLSYFQILSIFSIFSIFFLILLESQFFLSSTENFFLSQRILLSSEHHNLEVKKKSSLMGVIEQVPAS
jgi:hypothetical protein